MALALQLKAQPLSPSINWRKVKGKTVGWVRPPGLWEPSSILAVWLSHAVGLPGICRFHFAPLELRARMLFHCHGAKKDVNELKSEVPLSDSSIMVLVKNNLDYLH